MRRGSRGGFSAARRFRWDVIRLETTLEGFGLSREQSRYSRIDDERSRVERGVLSDNCRTWIIALITGSSSSSYSSESISAGAGTCGGGGCATGADEGTALGGDGGGVNARSTWTSRRIRFGLRGFCSGCCAGCFVAVGGSGDGVVAVGVESTTLAECVAGEK